MPNPLRLLLPSVALFFLLAPSLVHATVTHAPVVHAKPSALLLWSTRPTALPLSQLSSGSPDSGLSQAPQAPVYITIYGLVTDSIGQPVTNALVSIANSVSGATIVRRASTTGEFVIDSLLEGATYTIAVARLGYGAIETPPFTAHTGPRQMMTIVMHARSIVTILAGRPYHKPTRTNPRLASQERK